MLGGILEGRGADCLWDGHLARPDYAIQLTIFFNAEGRRGFRQESQSVYEQSRLCNKYPN